MRLPKWTPNITYNRFGFYFVGEILDFLGQLKFGNTATIPLYGIGSSRIVICINSQINYDWKMSDATIDIRLSNDVRRRLLRALTPDCIETFKIGSVKHIVTIS